MHKIGYDIFQAHENDEALVCVVHEPSSTANFFGNLHPCGRLYEQPFDLERARIEHQQFVAAMENFGVKIVHVEAILAEECCKGKSFDMKKRLRLEDLAMKQLKYKLSPNCEASSLTQEEAFYLSNEYKRQCIEQMNTSQLVQVVMTCPSVTLDRSHRDTSMIAVEHSMNPLGNLIFTRDQQITTKKGIVMANMASKARDGEVDLMEEVMRNLGASVIGRISAPALLEGGDFFMAGDTCFIGTGLRTNSMAVKYLMDADLIGCDYVVEVRDLFERSQDRMHLDCVFNIISHDIVLLMGSLENPKSLSRRLVTEYTRDPITKQYIMTRSDVEFSTYLRMRSFHIQGIPDQFQLLYGVNCLNLGNSNIIMMHEESARLVARNPHFKGRINVIEYGSVSSMYGSLHCTSQVVRRKNQQDDTTSRLSYSIKDPVSCPKLGQRPSLMLFVPEDVAYIYRNGIPAERQHGCDHRLLSMKGRSLVSLVLKEFSTMHLQLQCYDLAHIHVLTCEENFVKSRSAVRTMTPAAFFLSANSALATFQQASQLQIESVKSAVSYAFDKGVISCPIQHLNGAMDMVVYQNYAVIDSRFSGGPLVSWLENLGLKPLYVDVTKPYMLSQVLYVCSRFSLLCSELLCSSSLSQIKEHIPVNVIEISRDQVMQRVTFGFTEVSPKSGPTLLISSKAALDHLTSGQKDALQSTGVEIVPISLKTSEAIGVGSVRDFLIPL